MKLFGKVDNCRCVRCVNLVEKKQLQFDKI